jgi:adenylate kinase
VFTILLALAFSLAVCAVIGVGATTILNRVVAFVQEKRDRVSINR